MNDIYKPSECPETLNENIIFYGKGMIESWKIEEGLVIGNKIKGVENTVELYEGIKENILELKKPIQDNNPRGIKNGYSA
ncbi:MAG: hypothetical protein ABFQ65_01305 [Nanoarchaeota archaeon]